MGAVFRVDRACLTATSTLGAVVFTVTVQVARRQSELLHLPDAKPFEEWPIFCHPLISLVGDVHPMSAEVLLTIA